MAGKGSKLRKGANLELYRQNYDLIFKKDDDKKEDSCKKDDKCCNCKCKRQGEGREP